MSTTRPWTYWVTVLWFGRSLLCLVFILPMPAQASAATAIKTAVHLRVIIFIVFDSLSFICGPDQPLVPDSGTPTTMTNVEAKINSERHGAAFTGDASQFARVKCR